MRSAVAEASMAHSVGVDGSNLRLEHTTNGPGAGTFARLPDGAASRGCYNDVTTAMNDTHMHGPCGWMRMEAWSRAAVACWICCVTATLCSEMKFGMIRRALRHCMLRGRCASWIIHVVAYRRVA